MKVAGVVAGLGVTTYSVIGNFPSKTELRIISTRPLLNGLPDPLFAKPGNAGASGTDFLEEARFPMGIVIMHSNHQ